MLRTYYEKRYCFDCVSVHWLEVTPARQEICHGEGFLPQTTQMQYTRRLGHGIEVIEKSIPLPFDWQMPLECQERETIDVNQDW